MSTALITTDEALEVKRAQMQATVVAPVVAKADAVVITDAASAEAATELLTQIARATREIEDERVALKAPVLESGKRIDKFFKRLSEPLAAARSVVEPKILAYRKIEADRIAAENAERERIEREEREQAEAQRRAAENKAREQREAAARAAALAEAEALHTQDEGAAERAREARAAERQARVAEQVAAETQIVEQKTVREVQENTIKSTNGKAIARTVWGFEIEDPSRVPRQYLTVDEKAIGAAVRGGEREIPGVRIYSVEKLSARA